MTNQEEPQPIHPNAQAAAPPPTQTPSEQPPIEQAQALPPTEAQAQPPQPSAVPPPPAPYPFPPVLKLPWIAPARKGAVIAIGIAAAVAMFGAGIGAGAAIFHNDQARPSYQFRVPDFGQRQFPGFPQQLPTPSPTSSRTS